MSRVTNVYKSTIKISDNYIKYAFQMYLLPVSYFLTEKEDVLREESSACMYTNNVFTEKFIINSGK